METEDRGSVTGEFIALVQSQDQDAVRKLWERYLNRLLRLARSRLSPPLRRMADEEDVALSAFDSFCMGATEGRFPGVEDRDDLWRILRTITVRKAADIAKHERRRRPRSGRLVTEADVGKGSSSEVDLLSLVTSPGPCPELAAQFAEELHRLLDSLDNERLRRIALDRLAGYKDEEIARRQGCTRRTVQRGLTLIRNAWKAEVSE